MGSVSGHPEYRDPYRYAFTKCTTDKPFRFNYRFRVIFGAQFFTNFNLDFPPGDTSFYGEYRTRFGPCVEHTGVIYCTCDHCLSLALRRITCVRSPEVEGYDAYLFHCQEDFIAQNQEFYSFLGRQFFSGFDDMDLPSEEIRLHHSDTHEKRLLRIAAYRDLINSGAIANRLYLRSVWYKMKRNEWAKPGKYPRAIGDLGVSASLQGFRLTKFLKDIMASTTILINGGSMEFCSSPTPTRLTEVFQKLIDPPGRFYFVCFSDDSCLSIRVDGTVQMYNVDISSCDSSHGASMFECFVQLFPPHLRDEAHILVEQCTLPIRVRSYSNPKNVVILKPCQPVLYSGSTLTTVINNLASYTICFSITSQIISGKTRMIQAAENCGYVITLQHCPFYYDLQFLKHSPVYDVNGILRPLLNIGVLLRLSGTCHGDVDGPECQTLSARFMQFQHALLKAAYPYARFRMLANMKRQCNLEKRYSKRLVTQIYKLLEWKVDDTESYTIFHVDDQEMFRRYAFNDFDILTVVDEFSNNGLYTFTANPSLSKILDKDYDLQCLNV